MTNLNSTRVTAGKFYIADRSQARDIDIIIAGPFNSSEVANEEKRQFRREGVVGAVVLFLEPVDAKEVSA